MLNIKKECTGCMACVNGCAVGAIKIVKNEYGFVMPKVDTDICINCGRCEALCPINSEDGERTKPLSACSMYHKDPEVVRMSSSGGVFYALAKSVVESGGVAYGCYYDIEEKKAYLTDTDNVSVEALLTSKYVESYIGEDGFRSIESNVKDGRKVLFCGTPCQAAGLRSYMGRNYDNLLIVDFACGGVTAQKYLSDYLEKLEEEYGSSVVRMSFRDKYYGWGQNCFTVEFENGELYRKTAMADPFFFCFLRSSMQRLSCHGCKFSADHRSDICISDFWKCDHFDIDRNGRRGLSLVLELTEKGQRELETIKSKMHVDSLPVEEASYNLKERVCPESKLEEIYRDMALASKYGVTALRDSLLTDTEIEQYDIRQHIMDDEDERKLHPEIVGNGQIMK